MHFLSNSFTFVINGDWNKLYTQPVWIATNIFGIEELQVELNLVGIDYNIRYRKDDIIIQPSQNQFIFTCTSWNSEIIKYFESICRKFIECAVTPTVGSYGYNVSFIDDDTVKYSRIVDKIGDLEELAKSGIEVLNTELKRLIRYNGSVLHVVNNIINNKLITSFNEHHNNELGLQPEIHSDDMINFKNNCHKVLQSNGFIVEELED